MYDDHEILNDWDSTADELRYRIAMHYFDTFVGKKNPSYYALSSSDAYDDSVHGVSLEELQRFHSHTPLGSAMHMPAHTYCNCTDRLDNIPSLQQTLSKQRYYHMRYGQHVSVFVLDTVALACTTLHCHHMRPL